jgi:hypothetical protein
MFPLFYSDLHQKVDILPKRTKPVWGWWDPPLLRYFAAKFGKHVTFHPFQYLPCAHVSTFSVLSALCAIVQRYPSESRHSFKENKTGLGLMGYAVVDILWRKVRQTLHISPISAPAFRTFFHF